MRGLQAFYFLFFVFAFNRVSAQDSRQEYLKVITERADKIVATLGIQDSAQYYKVRTLMVNEYDQVNTHHEEKQREIQDLKGKFKSDNKVQKAKIAKLEQSKAKKLKKLNAKYVSNLSKLLTEEQVEGVKNGMTYGVLPLTYVAFQEMIPSLTVEQKQFVLSNLTEARELAMAEPGSKEKHAVFGKYKGRINNYLAKAGYDLKEEGAKWQERIKNKKSTL
jgi:Skp family chaperone for outer membrane proteins